MNIFTSTLPKTMQYVGKKNKFALRHDVIASCLLYKINSLLFSMVGLIPIGGKGTQVFQTMPWEEKIYNTLYIGPTHLRYKFYIQTLLHKITYKIT